MQYKYQTNSRKIMGDLHTPVSIYLKVRDTFPQSALLESSDFHAKENSISYLALKPIARIEVNRGVSKMVFPDDKEENRNSRVHNLRFIKYLLRGLKLKIVIGNIGLFGYTTFNCVKYTEN